MYFSILIHDEPNTVHLRDEHRQAHLDYLTSFNDQTIFAGPFVVDDDTLDLGSFRLIELADRATMAENSPGLRVFVPLNMRCSRKCAMPDSPGPSSAAPTRYQPYE